MIQNRWKRALALMMGAVLAITPKFGICDISAAADAQDTTDNVIEKLDSSEDTTDISLKKTGYEDTAGESNGGTSGDDTSGTSDDSSIKKSGRGSSSGNAGNSGSSKNTGSSAGSSASDDEKKYTLIVYMVGSNLESSYGAASADLYEMMMSDLDTENANLVVVTGGSSSWQLGIPNDQLSILHMEEDGFNIDAATDGSVNMGESSTLSMALDFAEENYPADHYGLILWDHGNGPVSGYGNDELYDYDGLTIPELTEAFSESVFGTSADHSGTSPRLDFIGFDACLMADIEVASALAPYTDYLIASQETEEGDGWDYSFLSKLASDAKKTNDCDALTKKIGSRILDAFGSYYKEQESSLYHPEATLSLMNLQSISMVKDAMNDFFSSMDGKVSKSYAMLAKVRANVKCFGVSAFGSKGDSLDLVDLGDLAEKYRVLFPSEAKNLQSALSELVLDQTSNVEDTTGVSVYFPYDNMYYFLTEGEGMYTKIGVSDGYIQFIENFTSAKGTKKTSADYEDQSLEQEADELTLTLTEEEQENLSRASYTILMETEEGVYTPVLSDCALEPDENGVLHVALDQQVFLATTGQESTKKIWPVKELEKSDSVTKYSSEVRLGTGSENSAVSYGYGEEQDALLTLEVNGGEANPTVVTAELESDQTMHTGKNTVNMELYSNIEAVEENIVPTEDTHQQPLPYDEWNTQGESSIASMQMDESFAFELCSITDLPEHFVCQFTLEDVNGNRYGSDLRELSDVDPEWNQTVDTDQGTLYLRIDGNYAEVLSYEGEDETLEIPSEIAGRPITVIGEGAFKGQHTIRMVVLADSVTEIRRNAFADSGLEQIRLGNYTEEICAYAFSGCTALEEISLPDSLKTIGAYAFSGCIRLSEVVLPKGLEKIGAAVFANDTNLTAISFSGENKAYTIEENILYTKYRSTVLTCAAGGVSDARLPESVSEIAEAAFAGADDLGELTLPVDLEKIGPYAFYECKGLQISAFPEHLVSIGSEAFGAEISSISEELPEYTTIRLGAELTSIGKNAFSGCIVDSYEVDEDNLVYTSKDGFLLNRAGDTLISCPSGLSGKVELPEGITTITASAFKNADGITELILPDSLITIADDTEFPAFLESLTVGPALTYWGNIKDCADIDSISVDPDNQTFSIKDGVVYSNDEDVLHMDKDDD